MEKTELKQAVETLLFITDQPIGIAKITQTIGAKDRDEVESAVREIKKDYEERGAAIQVLEIAEGYQMATKSDYAQYVRTLFKEKMAMRLSTAALETLSIVAYKQPLTRAEIEQIRGVEVIAALETLLEKGLIRVAGRKESVGRPLLYGTSPDFLRRFGLRSLEDLPPLDEFKVAGGEKETMASAGEGPFEPRNGLRREEDGIYEEDAAPSAESVQDVPGGDVPEDVREDEDAPRSETPDAP